MEETLEFYSRQSTFTDWIRAADKFCNHEGSFTELAIKTRDTQIGLFPLGVTEHGTALGTGLFLVRHAAIKSGLSGDLTDPETVKFIDAVLLTPEGSFADNAEILWVYPVNLSRAASEILDYARNEIYPAKHDLEFASLVARINREMDRRYEISAVNLG